jgi:hypothetical protein
MTFFSLSSEVQEQRESPAPPKTSAAAQLDELMAHLSEMQATVGTAWMIKSPVPERHQFILVELSSAILLFKNSKLTFIFPNLI